jgi:hypothetical protein
MAAGLGFKDFVTGEVLTAADVDGYLMQGVWVFASAAARDAAVTSPQEGNFAYLKDTNVTTYYTGSAWANLDTTGMTNPMTTTGDVIYSSPGSTPVRLGIGTANQVLTVNSGATAPEWKTPSAGGVTFSGCAVTRSTDLSTTNGSVTTVTFDTEHYDTDAYHSTATNTERFTIPTGKTGYFLWITEGAWGNSATGQRQFIFYKNGTRLGNPTPKGYDSITDSDGYATLTRVYVIALSAGDYVEVRALQSSGGNLDLRCDELQMSITYMGA